MDDFIYFLLIIGWLGYSFYKQSEKKKRQQAARRIEQPQNAVPGYSAPMMTENPEPVKRQTTPDFRKTLEEILLGQPISQEVIPENEAQSLEEIPGPAVSDEDKYQQYFDLETSEQPLWYQRINATDEKVDERIEETEKAMILQEEEDRNHFWNGFELRKAVIYSEVLNRKYVH